MNNFSPIWFSCSFCKKAFPEKWALINHRKNAHLKEIRVRNRQRRRRHSLSLEEKEKEDEKSRKIGKKDGKVFRRGSSSLSSHGHVIKDDDNDEGNDHDSTSLVKETSNGVEPSVTFWTESSTTEIIYLSSDCESDLVCDEDVDNQDQCKFQEEEQDDDHGQLCDDLKEKLLNHENENLFENGADPDLKILTQFQNSPDQIIIHDDHNSDGDECQEFPLSLFDHLDYWDEDEEKEVSKGVKIIEDGDTISKELVAENQETISRLLGASEKVMEYISKEFESTKTTTNQENICTFNPSENHQEKILKVEPTQEKLEQNISKQLFEPSPVVVRGKGGKLILKFGKIQNQDKNSIQSSFGAVEEDQKVEKISKFVPIDKQPLETIQNLTVQTFKNVHTNVKKIEEPGLLKILAKNEDKLVENSRKNVKISCSPLSKSVQKISSTTQQRRPLLPSSSTFESMHKSNCTLPSLEGDQLEQKRSQNYSTPLVNHCTSKTNRKFEQQNIMDMQPIDLSTTKTTTKRQWTGPLKMFPCNLCSKSFVWAKSLTLHRRKSHDLDLVPPPGASSVIKNSCDLPTNTELLTQIPENQIKFPTATAESLAVINDKNGPKLTTQLDDTGCEWKIVENSIRSGADLTVNDHSFESSTLKLELVRNDGGHVRKNEEFLRTYTCQICFQKFANLTCLEEHGHACHVSHNMAMIGFKPIKPIGYDEPSGNSSEVAQPFQKTSQTVRHKSNQLAHQSFPKPKTNQIAQPFQKPIVPSNPKMRQPTMSTSMGNDLPRPTVIVANNNKIVNSDKQDSSSGGLHGYDPYEFVSEEEIKRCPNCPKIFVCQKKFDVHLKTHIHPYKCDLCPKSFAKSSALRLHHTRHAKTTATAAAGGKIYNCQSCPDTFDHSSGLFNKHDPKEHSATTLMRIVSSSSPPLVKMDFQNSLTLPAGNQTIDSWNAKRLMAIRDGGGFSGSGSGIGGDGGGSGGVGDNCSIFLCPNCPKFYYSASHWAEHVAGCRIQANNGSQFLLGGGGGTGSGNGGNKYFRQNF